MGRRHIDETSPVGKLLHDQAIEVDGNAGPSDAQRGEDVSRSDVAWILDRDAIAGAEQHLRDQIEPLLRAVRDRHIVSRSLHAARDREMTDDRFAELSISGGVAVDSRLRASGAGQHSAPIVVGKQGGIGKTGAEVEDRGRCKCRRQRDRVPDGSGTQGSARSIARHLASVDSGCADEGARSSATRDEPLGGQSFEGDGNARAGHAEPKSQLPARGDTFTRPKSAGEDRLAQLAVDFPVQVRAAYQADVEVHHSGRTLSPSGSSTSKP